jgi:hypothetical protein
MPNYIKNKKMGGTSGQLQTNYDMFKKFDPNESKLKSSVEAPISTFIKNQDALIDVKPYVDPLKPDVSLLKPDVSLLKPDVSPLKTDVSPLKTDVSPLKTDVDKDVDELNEEISQEEQDALMAEEARKQKLEALKNQVEEIIGELQELKPSIDEIYTKYETNDKNTKIQDLDEADKLIFDNYIFKYKEYLTILDEIAITENEEAGGLFDSYVIQPISDAFGNMFDRVKNGIAKGLTGSFKFWSDTVARSMEEMEPSLKRIQEAKSRIYGMASQGLNDATKGVDAAAPGLSPDLSSALPSASDLPATPTLPSPSVAALQGGGRYYNIKEVQKGGAAAAKRAENSIKQFLSSSVTSSHILKMVKRKTKAKRKRNDKRYSRKRAKK